MLIMKLAVHLTLVASLLLASGRHLSSAKPTDYASDEANEYDEQGQYQAQSQSQVQGQSPAGQYQAQSQSQSQSQYQGADTKGSSSDTQPSKYGLMDVPMSMFAPFANLFGAKHEDHQAKEQAAHQESAKYHDKEPGKDKEVKKYEDWHKLILNPLELCKAISKHFNLPLESLIEKLGHGLVLGLEAVLYPLVVSLKIVEKVFVPDACRLRLVCRWGAYLEILRDHMTKFSPNFLGISKLVEALTKGITGKDCTQIYACEPKLKQPYEELKGQEQTKEHDYGHGKEVQASDGYGQAKGGEYSGKSASRSIGLQPNAIVGQQKLASKPVVASVGAEASAKAA